jgi:hypothetical protein
MVRCELVEPDDFTVMYFVRWLGAKVGEKRMRRLFLTGGPATATDWWLVVEHELVAYDPKYDEAAKEQEQAK